MCHLSIEKALKGLFVQKFQQNPPKTHDLLYLAKRIALELPAELQGFLEDLNELSVPTRYPDELERLVKDYEESVTEKVLNQTKELLLCLKQKL